MSKNNNNEATVLDTVFTDNMTFNSKGYKQRELTAEDLALMELYDSVEINLPISGTVYELKYMGNKGGYFLFDGNFKDYVRVENKTQERNAIQSYNIGDIVEVLVTGVDNKENLIKGSVSSVTVKHVIGNIIESNPAGYTVEINLNGSNIKSFMPNYLAGINKISNPKSLVGQKLEVMIESYDSQRRSAIVSRRKYLETLIEDEIKTITVGNEYTGTITDKTDYGVFVEFKQSLTGMIHKSNLSPNTNLSSLKPGDEINFFVREIIENKIILTQVFKETVWDNITEGNVYTGKVTSKKSFGYLVALDDSTTGLIKVDAEDTNPIQLTEGQNIEVKVITFDKKSRIITLVLN